MTDGIGALAPPVWTTAKAQGKTSPEKTKDAAQQFEALMIGELLKTAREGGSSGWLGTGDEDQPGQTSLDMAEQQLATVMAKGGGLGLTKMITQDLDRKP